MKRHTFRKAASALVLTAGVTGATIWLLRRNPSPPAAGRARPPKASDRPRQDESAQWVDTASGAAEAEEAQFTPEQLKDYYRVYKQPFVKYLRTAFDGYLAGTLNSDELETLRAFGEDYYKSKFVVLAVEEGLLGGNFVTIIFQDRPDQIFKAWVYEKGRGKYELREFAPGGFSEEEVKGVRERYRRFLRDKTHAM